MKGLKELIFAKSLKHCLAFPEYTSIAGPWPSLLSSAGFPTQDTLLPPSYSWSRPFSDMPAQL